MSTTVLHYAMHALFAFEYLPGLLESIVIEDDEEKERQIEIQRLKEVAVSKFVVSISIPPSSFKPVSLSLSRISSL